MLQRLQIYCAERYLQSELWLMSMVFYLPKINDKIIIIAQYYAI